MKTDDLITLLARGAGPAPRLAMASRLLPLALGGALLSALLAVWVLGAIPAAMYATPAPWMKLAYAGALAVAGGWLTARLARPVAATAAPARTALTVVGLMLALGLGVLAATPPGQRLAALLGHPWPTCPWSVFLLSLPALAATLALLRQRAPTRLRAAGAAAGLFAGALGAAGYALSCTEESAAFVAVWYTLGIVLSTALGALLGPRVLRW
jgi:hypothetical protein